MAIQLNILMPANAYANDAAATTEKKKETKYDTGTYAVNVTDEAGFLECIFQDGELYQETFDGIFEPWGGKDLT